MYLACCEDETEGIVVTGPDWPELKRFAPIVLGIDGQETKVRAVGVPA